ncbi:ABC transporter substrate-binding protein [bacterium]|nr:ABC transporter substrate-binding protein [candidate division CSSED10-310 bacterium]
MTLQNLKAILVFLLNVLWLIPVTTSEVSDVPVEFRFRLATNPPTLDPALSTDTTSGAVILKINDGLVQFEPMSLEVIPAVASSWEISDDGNTYIFHLRQDVMFHNGRPVTAEDVRYSFERTLNPATRSGRTFVLDPILGARAFMNRDADSVKGIEVLDDYTIRIQLTEPFAPFLAQLCMEAASIVPREVCDKAGPQFSLHPVGCGPYQFVEWKQDVEITLRKFPAHYQWSPDIDVIKFRIIESVPTAFEEYKTGGLDLLDQIPNGQIQTVRDGYPDDFRVWPYLSIYYIGFNNSKPPFQNNRKLRQAFNYAVDRKKICLAIKEGLAYPVAGVLPPGIPGYDPDLEGYPYDPDRARSLLAEAGYSEGRGFPEITLWHNRDPRHTLIGQCIQYYLGQIGIRIRLKNLEWAAYIEAVDEGEPLMFRMAWVADYPDADNFLFTLLNSSQFGAAGNYARFCNPEFDQLTRLAKSETDPGHRIELYRAAERIAIADAPWIFIYYEREMAMIKPCWQNVQLTPQGDFAIPLEAVRRSAEIIQ